MKADQSNFFGYNKVLQPYANKLRKNMTKAEACLWKYVLKAGQMNGYSFRRQRPVLNYIADFMCKELKLIIEVDGITHTYEGAKERDEIRQHSLEKSGLKVIRFEDDEVLNIINSVRDRIKVAIEEIEKSNLPLPPRRGG